MLRRGLGVNALLAGAVLAVAASAGAQSTNVYFGDTHLHSSYSADASLMGNRSADPDTAYRYAKGLPVVHPGYRGRVQIETPLDFLVVSDHAEFLGVVPALLANDTRVGDSPKAREFLERLRAGDLGAAFGILVRIGSTAESDPGLISPEVSRETWHHIIDAAERHNEPGRFTTLLGWEWSSMPAALGGPNLHRVVMMREGGDVARRFLPYSVFDSDRPEDLWAWLEKTGADTGAHFIAIPHNSNISQGQMFDAVDSDGKPVDAAYARTRARWEPVAEITQIKGDSETHPLLSPDDDFTGYELFIIPREGPAQPGSFLRSALRRGLEIEARTGVNPYRYALIGASDAHTGLAAVEENRYGAKWAVQSTPQSTFAGDGPGQAARMGAAGLAAVWAPENTREAIFDAMRRREVYATTGTRLHVHFFGGFDYDDADLGAADPAAAGYRKGVPMGGELEAGERAPVFMVHAARDPVGANLDRIQIVKGWVDADGASHERVYDVAASDGRAISRGGGLEPVGSTVDLATGRWTNAIGDPQLSALWRDPDHDAAQAAFYYARVLEIPTPRYSLLDALALDREHPAHLPATIQERAYTSPIWVRPTRP